MPQGPVAHHQSLLLALLLYGCLVLLLSSLSLHGADTATGAASTRAGTHGVHALPPAGPRAWRKGSGWAPCRAVPCCCCCGCGGGGGGGGVWWLHAAAAAAGLCCSMPPPPPLLVWWSWCAVVDATSKSYEAGAEHIVGLLFLHLICAHTSRRLFSLCLLAKSQPRRREQVRSRLPSPSLTPIIPHLPPSQSTKRRERI